MNTGTLMLAGQLYSLLKGAIYTHPTLTEGFFSLPDRVEPMQDAALSGAAANGWRIES